MPRDGDDTIANRSALRLMDGITAEVTRLDGDLRDAFRGEARMRQLLLIPGVGQRHRLLRPGQVGEVARFRSADQLCSWAGLTPTERTSDAHTRRGHISKQGSFRSDADDLTLAAPS